jgi:hypothetical protein
MRKVCYFLLLGIVTAIAQAAGGKAVLSFDKLLPEIRKHAPGSLYDVDGPYPGPKGKSLYRVKWMSPEGRIVWFAVDASNGHILGVMQTPRRWSEFEENWGPDQDEPPPDRGPRWDDRGGPNPIPSPGRGR